MTLHRECWQNASSTITVLQCLKLPGIPRAKRRQTKFRRCAMTTLSQFARTFNSSRFYCPLGSSRVQMTLNAGNYDFPLRKIFSSSFDGPYITHSPFTSSHNAKNPIFFLDRNCAFKNRKQRCFVRGLTMQNLLLRCLNVNDHWLKRRREL